MAGPTEWVRHAFEVLGCDASTNEVIKYVLRQAPELPRNHVSLAIRNMRRTVERKRFRAKPGSSDGRPQCLFE